MNTERFLCDFLVLMLIFNNSYTNDVNDTLVYSKYKRLHKCFCRPNQILSNDICRIFNTTIPVLQDETYEIIEYISTIDIEHVDISILRCSDGYGHFTIDKNSFVLMENGNLLITEHGIEIGFFEYCIEHVEDYEGLGIVAHICLVVPPVPECCFGINEHQANEICTRKDPENINVTFAFGNKLFERRVKTVSSNLQCADNENLTHISGITWSKTNQLLLSNNGMVLERKASVLGDMIYYAPSKYCLKLDESEYENKVVASAAFCYKNPVSSYQESCEGKVCVRKCCERNTVFDMENYECIPAVNKNWKPRFYGKDLYTRNYNFKLFEIVIGFPLKCEFFSLSKNNDPPDKFILLINGSLYVENWEMSLESHQYCLDHFRYDDVEIEEAMVCFIEVEEEDVGCKSVEHVLYPILLVISCVCLAITLIVYAVIPDLHAKIQGKCLIANVASLLLAYICLVNIQLFSKKLSEAGCTTFGLLTQFSMLASFFWLNTMSFDIWRSLRSMKIGRNSPNETSRRYLYYSLYSWGCPLIIVLVTITMQHLPDSVDKTNLILPRIGESSCFLTTHDPRVHWIYLYIYISVILIANSFFFVHLTMILIKTRRFSESALGAKNQLHKKWAKLYIKLFLVMGITWIFEVVSWMEGSCVFWIATDIINALRGFLIFVVFVCKRDILKKLVSRSPPTFSRMHFSGSTSFFSRSSNRNATLFECMSRNTASTGANVIANMKNEMDTAV